MAYMWSGLFCFGVVLLHTFSYIVVDSPTCIMYKTKKRCVWTSSTMIPAMTSMLSVTASFADRDRRIWKIGGRNSSWQRWTIPVGTIKYSQGVRSMLRLKPSRSDICIVLLITFPRCRENNIIFFLIRIDVCVCVPLNYLTCEKNGAIEMQHNNNNNTNNNNNNNCQ